MPATEYKGLHSAEKKELRDTGRDMYDAVNALDRALTRNGLRYTTYGRYFLGVRDKLTVIYKELCEDKRYIDDTDRYNIARKELDDGNTLMFNANGRNELKGAGDYEELEKKVKTCQATTTKYSQAWIEILTFDRKNRNPNAQRLLGYYAFQKADMDEMLGLLAEMGRMCSDKYEQ